MYGTDGRSGNLTDTDKKSDILCRFSKPVWQAGLSRVWSKEKKQGTYFKIGQTYFKILGTNFSLYNFWNFSRDNSIGYKTFLFSVTFNPQTVIRELSINVECSPFANLRISAVICLPARLRRSPLRLQPGGKLSVRHKHAILRSLTTDLELSRQSVLSN